MQTQFRVTRSRKSLVMVGAIANLRRHVVQFLREPVKILADLPSRDFEVAESCKVVAGTCLSKV